MNEEYHSHKTHKISVKSAFKCMFRMIFVFNIIQLETSNQGTKKYHTTRKCK